MDNEDGALKGGLLSHGDLVEEDSGVDVPQEAGGRRGVYARSLESEPVDQL